MSVEDEPVLRLKCESGDLEAIRGKSALYRHLGEHAVFDCVFLITGETGDGREGNPVFIRGFLKDDMIEQVTQFMLTRGFECHLNLPEALQCFVDVHAKVVQHQSRDIEDGIPEEWLDGTTED